MSASDGSRAAATTATTATVAVIVVLASVVGGVAGAGTDATPADAHVVGDATALAGTGTGTVTTADVDATSSLGRPAPEPAGGPFGTTATATTATPAGAPVERSSPSASASNLLANPGCEADEAATPDGWTDASATAPSVYCTPLDGDGPAPSTQAAPEGALAFADGRADGASAVVVQTVPVVGGRTYELAGWVGTDDASTTDHVDLAVRYRDASGAAVSNATLTDRRSAATDAFERVSTVSTAPADATTAQVRVRLDDADGTGYADAFVDALAFRRTGPSVDARNDTLALPVGGSLPATASLFAGGDDGADRRGPAGATVVSFGGGDVDGSVGTNAAGATVELAGGDLTVRADGGIALAGPTTHGTYAFDYRLSDGSAVDVATVRVRVLDGAPNALGNPGCEVRTPGGAAVGWTAPSGVAAAGCLDPSGAPFTSLRGATGGFAVGDVRDPAAAAGEDVALRRTATVDGGVTYRLAARVATDDALSATDRATLSVQFLDGTGMPVGDRGDVSGRSTTDRTFDRVATVATAPADAASARVTVRLVNADGAGHADAFVDDVALRRVDAGASVVAFDDAFVVPAYRSLTASVLGGEAGVDGSGAGNATVASFGGGDLDGSVGTNAAGDTVGLAGGNLTVAADGTVDVDAPVRPGTYAFDYRLSDGATADEATVRLRVAPVGTNLLATPGCERTGIADRPLGWTDESGGRAVACLDVRAGGFSAQSWSNGTYAFGDRTADGGTESVVRTVDVTGDREYRLSARVGTDDPLSTADRARVELRFQRADGSRIDGAGLTLGDRRSASNGSFERVADTVRSPAGAARAEVGVVLVDRDGGTADSFVDDVSLSLTADVVDATPPVARIDADGRATTGRPVRFDGSDSTDADGRIVAHEWDFDGDGDSDATGAVVSRTYGSPGSYVAELTVRDAAGNVDTDRVTVQVDSPADVEVAVTGTNAPVTAGETVTVDVRARNEGTRSARRTVRLAVDGTVVDGQSVAVDGRGTETLTLSWATGAGDAGTRSLRVSTVDHYATATVAVVPPPSWAVALADAPASVVVGETATFVVEVRNPGPTAVTRTVALADGPSTIASVTATLGPNESRTIRLSWNTSGAALGEHRVSVTADGDPAATTVAVLPATPFPDGLPGERGVTPRPADEPPDSLYRDVNGDGAVGVADVVRLLFADWAAIDATPAQRRALDFDGDGSFGLADVIALLFDL